MRGIGKQAKVAGERTKEIDWRASHIDERGLFSSNRTKDAGDQATVIDGSTMVIDVPTRGIGKREKVASKQGKQTASRASPMVGLASLVARRAPTPGGRPRNAYNPSNALDGPQSSTLERFVSFELGTSPRARRRWIGAEGGVGGYRCLSPAERRGEFGGAPPRPSTEPSTAGDRFTVMGARKVTGARRLRALLDVRIVVEKAQRLDDALLDGLRRLPTE
jgi:hypothetical protein